MNVPSEIRRGSTALWIETVELELADGTLVGKADEGWVLSLYLRGPGTHTFIAAQHGSTSQHLFNLAPATTATPVVGRYAWFARVEKAGAVHDVENGHLEITPDPEDAEDSGFVVSYARKMRDAIRAALDGTASRIEAGYTISAPGGNGRSINFIPRDELLSFLNYFEQIVANEEAQEAADAGTATGRRIRTRFV